MTSCFLSWNSWFAPSTTSRRWSSSATTTATIAGSATALTIAGIASDDKAKASEEERTGRFTILKIDLSENTEFPAALDVKAKPEKKAEDQAALRKVLGEAQRSFESRPLPERLEVFDPALAADTRDRALLAVAASWLAVLAYLRG